MTTEATDPRPTIFAQLGIRDVAGDDCELTLEMPVTPGVTNPRGGLQGGLIATLADIVGGRLARDVSPTGNVATSDMSLHYLSPITRGPARATARILRVGARSIVVEVRVVDAGGTHPAERDAVCVVAMLTFAILRAPA